MRLKFLSTTILGLAFAGMATAQNQAPEGFTALFNGKNLDGWFGHGTKDPRTLWKMTPEQLEAHKEKTREDIRKHWSVENGELVNDGKGLYLTTNKDYGDFELMFDVKVDSRLNSGVQIRSLTKKLNEQQKAKQNNPKLAWRI